MWPPAGRFGRWIDMPRPKIGKLPIARTKDCGEHRLQLSADRPKIVAHKPKHRRSPHHHERSNCCGQRRDGRFVQKMTELQIPFVHNLLPSLLKSCRRQNDRLRCRATFCGQRQPKIQVLPIPGLLHSPNENIHVRWQWILWPASQLSHLHDHRAFESVVRSNCG